MFVPKKLRFSGLLRLPGNVHLGAALNAAMQLMAHRKAPGAMPQFRRQRIAGGGGLKIYGCGAEGTHRLVIGAPPPLAGRRTRHQLLRQLPLPSQVTDQAPSSGGEILLHLADLYPRIGFVVTNTTRRAERVMTF